MAAAKRTTSHPAARPATADDSKYTCPNCSSVYFAPAGRTALECDACTEKSVEAKCIDCGRKFSYVPLKFQSREVAAREVCTDCVDVRKQKDAVLARMERQHLDKLEGAEREAAIHQLLDDIGANPWEHGHATLDNFDPADAPAALGSAREFAAAVLSAAKFQPVRGLYLWGDTGPGKTHLAVSVVRYLIENGYNPKRIVYDHAAELIARIQDTYGRREDSTMAVLDRRINADLWILDDFGTERASDDVNRHMTVIFTRRGMRPSLVTSNYSADRLNNERPDLARVLSRLGPKYFRVREVSGRDRRFDMTTDGGK